MNYRFAALALVLAVPVAAACGDNASTSSGDGGAASDAGTGTDSGSGSDSGGSGDGGTTTDGSADGNADAADAAPTTSTAAIVAGDFAPGHAGVLAKMDTKSLVMTPGLAASGTVGDDPMLRHYGNEIFVVNRSDGNSLTILDDSTFMMVEQLGTGANSNPQDVAVVGNKLYVPAYGGKGVDVLTRGTMTNVEIDLSADDPDGKPNCNSAIAVGTDVYVACGLLDDTALLAPRGNGKVYVINSATDTVRTSFSLTTKNPFGLLEAIGDGNLLVSSVDFADNSGCIEKITTGTAPTSACLVTNATLGGFASRMQVQNAQTVWFALVDMSFTTGKLVSYALAGGATHTLSASAQQINDVGVCPDGTIAVTDIATGDAGVRSYSTTAERTAGPLGIGMKPSAQHGLVCF